MKYLIIILLGVLLGIHWSTDFGWFIILIIVSLAITYVYDRDYEKEISKKDQEKEKVD